MIDIGSLVSYYREAYQARSRIPHTPIPQPQIDRFAAIAEGFPVDETDVRRMIDAYFVTDFHKPVDYRFGHFTSDNVFEILYFEHIHGGGT